jgi:RloB-like protein
LLVFVEGLRTEELYLVDWRRRCRDRVLVTVDPYRGAPLQLVERAVAAKRAETREARRGRGRGHDQIWCVFDVDEHPNLDRAVRLAAQHGVNLAISNPCIELWFVLHFEDRTAYIDRKEAQGRAQTLLQCGKVLTQPALDALAYCYPVAADRAKKLDDKHVGDGSPTGSNPSSSVWRLIEVIRSACGVPSHR